MTEVMYAPSLPSGTSLSGDSPELESTHLLSIERASNQSPVSDGTHKSAPSAPQIYRAAGLRPPSHPPTAKDWELYRDVILKTYKVEAKSVKELKSILAERYGFRASEVSYRRKILEPAGVVPADEKSSSQAMVKKSTGKNIKRPSKREKALEDTLRVATDAFKRSNSLSVYRKNMEHRARWEDEKLDMFFGRVMSPQPFRPLDMPGDAQSLHLALGEIDKYYTNFFSAEKYTPENIQKDFENMQLTKQPRTPVGLDPLICLINDYNNAVMFAQQQKYADARLAVESISERTKHALRNQGPHLLIYLLVMTCDSDCPAEFIFNNYLNRYLVDLCKILVGPNHPITLILWQILMAESKTQMGEVLVRKSLDIFKNVFGTAHGETLLLMISVTNILWQQQLYVEAEAFLQQTLELSVPVFGGSDFYSCHARYSLVYCRALLRNWEGVRETVNDIFAYNEQGTVYELGLVLLEAVADMFRENEDYSYAEYILSKIFIESTITRGADHQFTKNIQANIENIQKLSAEKQGNLT